MDGLAVDVELLSDLLDWEARPVVADDAVYFEIVRLLTPNSLTNSA